MALVVALATETGALLTTELDAPLELDGLALTSDPFIIPTELRTSTPPLETRSTSITMETRTMSVPMENRTTIVDPEERVSNVFNPS